MISILKFAKEHNSVKTVGGDMALVLPTLSDNALYLYQVLPKYLIIVASESWSQKVGSTLWWSQMLTQGCMDGHTYERKENQIPISCHA